MPNAASSKQDKRLRDLRSCMFCTLLCITIGVSGQQRGTQLPHPQVPDDNAPNTKSAHHQMPTNEVNEKLRKEFDPKNAAYAGSSIQAAVDDQSISLTGTVKSRIQHEMALQLALAYAGDRKIIDRLVLQEAGEGPLRILRYSEMPLFRPILLRLIVRDDVPKAERSRVVASLP